MSVIYRIADENERDAAISLIDRVFSHELGFPGVRPDEFDQDALFCLVSVNGQENNGRTLVGAARIVPDGPRGLPLDRYVNLSSIRSQTRRLAEVSRLACLKEHRRHFIAVNGVRFLKETTTQLGLTHLVIDSLLPLVPLYERMGFQKHGEPFFDETVYKDSDLYGAPNAQVMFAAQTDLHESC